MRIRVIAVGSRMPAWVRTGVEQYAVRLGPALKLELLEIDAGNRRAGTPVARAIAEEGRRVLTALRPREHVVVLEERGREMSSAELARWLAERLGSGEDLAVCIGGPDGHAPEVIGRAALRWSLSRLTLPHALVRIVLVEQLYRAQSMLANHPYHRP